MAKKPKRAGKNPFAKKGPYDGDAKPMKGKKAAKKSKKKAA